MTQPTGSEAGKFAQPALDRAHEWRLEAIQKTDPHVVRMDYDRNAQEYRGTFPISADGSVTARLNYVRVGTSGNADAGKFLVTTFPLDTSRTLANLFAGGTVDALIVQVATSQETAVRARKIIEKVVKDERVTNTLAIVTKEARRSDPGALNGDATAYVAYVRINFHFTHGEVRGGAAIAAGT